MTKVNITKFEIPKFIGDDDAPILAVFDATVDVETYRSLNLWRTAAGYSVRHAGADQLASSRYDEIVLAAADEYEKRTQ